MLNSPWCNDEPAQIVLSQKVTGDIQSQKFPLMHNEKKVLSLADCQLPERL